MNRSVNSCGVATFNYVHPGVVPVTLQNSLYRVVNLLMCLRSLANRSKAGVNMSSVTGNALDTHFRLYPQP